MRVVKFELWGISVIKFTWTARLVQWLREALLSPQESAYSACKYLGAAICGLWKLSESKNVIS